MVSFRIWSALDTFIGSCHNLEFTYNRVTQVCKSFRPLLICCFFLLLFLSVKHQVQPCSSIKPSVVQLSITEPSFKLRTCQFATSTFKLKVISFSDANFNPRTTCNLCLCDSSLMRCIKNEFGNYTFITVGLLLSL